MVIKEIKRYLLYLLNIQLQRVLTWITNSLYKVLRIQNAIVKRILLFIFVYAL